MCAFIEFVRRGEKCAVRENKKVFNTFFLNRMDILLSGEEKVCLKINFMCLLSALSFPKRTIECIMWCRYERRKKNLMGKMQCWRWIIFMETMKLNFIAVERREKRKYLRKLKHFSMNSLRSLKTFNGFSIGITRQLCDGNKGKVSSVIDFQALNNCCCCRCLVVFLSNRNFVDDKIRKY